MSQKLGRRGIEPFEGMWDFDGSCAPKPDGSTRFSQKTFTLGCFQWVKMANGKVLKRGKVSHRVSGKASCNGSIEYAHNVAEKYCAKKDSQQ